MDNRKIFLNVGSSILQIAVGSVVVFYLYHLVFVRFGPEKMGMWSLVFATTAFLNMSTFGLLGSLVRYVPKFHVANDYESISKLVQTVSIFTFISSSLAITAIWFGSDFIFKSSGIVSEMEAVNTLLNYALVSIWFNIIGGIYSSVLEGLQLVYVKNILITAGYLIYLGFGVLLIGHYGLMGLVYAQILQNIFLLCAGLIIVRKIVKSLPILPYKWDTGLFKMSATYGAQCMSIFLLSLAFDPLTKILMSRFGGLSLVGVYEMASRLVNQIRNLIGQVSQALIPTISYITAAAPNTVKILYGKMCGFVLIVSIPAYISLVILAELISQVWLGTPSRSFVLIISMLSLGSFFMTVTGPAFAINTGQGNLSRNILGFIIMSVLNICLGGGFGWFFGGMGVVFGWILAMIAGSLFVQFVTMREESVRNLAPDINLWGLIAYWLIGLLSVLALDKLVGFNTLGKVISVFVIYLMMMRIIAQTYPGILAQFRIFRHNQPQVVN